MLRSRWTADALRLLDVMLIAMLVALLVRADGSPAAVPPQTALIEQSAATNSPGFSIAVARDGQVTITAGAATRATTVGKTLVAQLYADLSGVAKLTELAAGHCAKSASFGTRTTVVFRGERTPDLQCAQDSPGRALSADVAAITGSLTALLPAQSRRTLPVGRRLPPEPALSP